MKKILFSVLALLAFAGSGAAQNLPSYVPANGLVGWWPFNGNANDESGNGYNGTVIGATLTTDRFGNSNAAYNFNGTSDNIQLALLTALNNQTTVSISYWVKSDLQFLNGQGGGTVFSHWIQSSGSGAIGINSQVTNQGALNIDMIAGVGAVSNTQIISSNSWSHIVFLYNGSNSNQNQKCSIYVNGIFEGYFGNNNIPMSTGNQADKTVIGAQVASTLWWYFKGKIDDVGIWNQALTQQEITALYQGGNTTTNCLDLPSNLQQGLVGYWPFCGNANDESGNGNNGTVNGATLTTDRFGNAGSAYGFDGSNFISIQPNSNLDITTGSLSCWFYRVNNDDNDALFSVRNDVLNTRFSIHVANQNQGIGMYNGTPPFQFVANNIANFNWYHAVLVFQTNFWELYINGVSVGVLNQTIGSNTGSNVWIGKADNSGNYNSQNWFGSLDDIAIWNRALSQEEISQLYNQGICKTSITVTDTLLIHTGITSYNPVAYQNTLKVWPNPGNQDITLDAGNLASMQGWKIKISNSLGQEVYPATLISQQQQVLDLSNWGGNGLYLLHLINPQGHITEVKKIVLAP